jgi:hypothetical protein
MTTGIVFGLLALAHIARMLWEDPPSGHLSNPSDFSSLIRCGKAPRHVRPTLQAPRTFLHVLSSHLHSVFRLIP